MSSKCKYKFSSTNNIITNDWNRLANETIKALELQKSWLNKGYIEKDKGK